MKRISFTKEDWRMLHWVRKALREPWRGPYPHSAVKFLFRKVMELSGHKLPLLIIAAGLLASCTMTVAPKPVYASVIAFDENVQNAGVIDCDANGCLVTSGWIAKYKAMETEFKAPLAADANIKPSGSNYRVSYEVQNHYAEMRASQRGP